MNHRIRKSAFALLTLLLVISQFSSARNLSQEGQGQPRKRFTIVPYYQSRTGCHPVEVKAVSIGAQPPEVVTSSVTIESFSGKPIIAVKLSWKVYNWDVGLGKRRGPCNAASEPGEVILSGTTPLIQIGLLSQKQTCNISTVWPKVTGPATKTVFIDQPIIAWDEIKSLTNDGSRDTFKDNYAAVIFVSEIHFEDGTTWKGTI